MLDDLRAAFPRMTFVGTTHNPLTLVGGARRWLAWTWDNLLLSCNVCNRPQRDGRGKGVRFPLGQGSGLLALGQFAASVEAPLLLDPGADDAIEHIVFRRERRAAECVWVPRPRNGSLRGDTTIRVCALDVTEKVERYTAYVRDVVTREVDRWEQLHPYTAPRSRLDVWRSIEDGLYAPSRPFVALSYDALCVLVDDDALAACGASRRRPGD